MQNDIKNLSEIKEEENTLSNISSELSFKLDNIRNEALIEELVGRGDEYREHEQMIGRFLKDGKIHKTDAIKYNNVKESDI